MADFSDTGYFPNRGLKLTPDGELRRLKQLVADFKQYDKQRTEAFHKLQLDYQILEESFYELKNSVNEADYDATVVYQDGGKQGEKKIPVWYSLHTLYIAHKYVKILHDQIEELSPYSYFVPVGDHRNEYTWRINKLKTKCRNAIKQFYKFSNKIKNFDIPDETLPTSDDELITLLPPSQP